METRTYTRYHTVGCAASDCRGCGQCCRGMGDSIRLDPLDVHRLTRCLGKTFPELLEHGLALGNEEGLLLPHIRMDESDACPFLREGICTIHGERPGICRLFPLGRDYDGDTRTFRYFLLEDACPRKGGKVQIADWIGIPSMDRYEAFVADWHYLVRDFQAALRNVSDPEYAKQLSLFVLKVFYLTPFGEEDDPAFGSFYASYRIRSGQARSLL